MHDRDDEPASETSATEDEPRQPPRLSPEEVARIENEEEWEELIEAPPDGDLSIISDENVPGRPG